MTEVVLHIGLHKTATRFLQRAVFTSLDPSCFLVNPEPLASTLKTALRHPDSSAMKRVGDDAASALREAGDRTLLLSDPTISGDMYSSHEDWQRNRDLVYRLFPGATIIYFVRRHAGWLHSAYRQALVKGPGMPIEFFLNFRDGSFRQRRARVVGGARNVNAFDLRFLDIYLGYVERFGAERVYLFRQEDLRVRPDAVYTRLAEALQLEYLPPLPVRVSGNRAFSALAIHLLFPGIYREPPPTVGERLRPWPIARTQRRLRKLRALLIHHVFDRLIYRDWDLLQRHGMRTRLDELYARDDAGLAAIAEEILEHGPGEQARERAESCRPSAPPQAERS